MISWQDIAVWLILAAAVGYVLVCALAALAGGKAGGCGSGCGSCRKVPGAGQKQLIEISGKE